MSTSPSFSPDPKIAKMAEAYAHDAIDFAGRAFQTKLDWSDASIERVETILGKLNQSLPAAKPPEEAVGISPRDSAATSARSSARTTAANGGW